jgi:hypothetical protein
MKKIRKYWALSEGQLFRTARSTMGGGGGEKVFGLSDSAEKIVWILDLANILHGLQILLIQRIVRGFI